ncbi:oxidoreductase [Sulfitobacter alexandrii]|uniref:Oxidoreductase n=1 Tax=Sulfitobacter alexandrii TaxID=1917485 RepID=A0A1J0WDN1_9RHOB|nr:molybdopterin-dependent oxidoreductase [Sulfitobacter alexandrii]APE42418.1 oxidoreductase [Sulfitobacter alexandrii]
MFRALFPALALVAASALSAGAEELAQPQGEVILTVSGPLATTNVDGTAQFDLEMLEALDATTFETTTIWTEGEHSFTGVSLDLLVDRLGLEGETLRATAINDYAIDIPLSDAVEGGPIVAYRMDGDTMSVRDKGPLWIVYPYDANPDYRTEVVYSRSIWQLDRIEVVE